MMQDESRREKKGTCYSPALVCWLVLLIVTFICKVRSSDEGVGPSGVVGGLWGSL